MADGTHGLPHPLLLHGPGPVQEGEGHPVHAHEVVGAPVPDRDGAHGPDRGGRRVRCGSQAQAQAHLAHLAHLPPPVRHVHLEVGGEAAGEVEHYPHRVGGIILQEEEDGVAKFLVS